MPTYATLPPAVPRGSRIAVVAPGNAGDWSRVVAGTDMLRAAGFDVVVADHVWNCQPGVPLSPARDARKADEINALVADPNIVALWSARGGYGCSRLLKYIDFAAWTSSPTWLVGFSDITVLTQALAHHGVASVAGPMVEWLAEDTAFTATVKVLAGQTPPPLSGTDVWAPGRAVGPLVGGNLTMCATLCGGPYSPRWRDSIVLLEDTGERPYRLDRSLEQLTAAHAFDGVAGVAVGHFDDCDETRPGRAAFEVSVAETLRSRLNGMGVPVVAGFPFGHGATHAPLLIGRPATLDTKTCMLSQ